MKIYTYNIDIFKTTDKNHQYFIFDDFVALNYCDYTMYMDEIIFSKIEEEIKKLSKEQINCDDVLRFNIPVTEEELFYLQIKYSDKFNINVT